MESDENLSARRGPVDQDSIKQDDLIELVETPMPVLETTDDPPPVDPVSGNPRDAGDVVGNLIWNTLSRF